MKNSEDYGRLVFNSRESYLPSTQYQTGYHVPRKEGSTSVSGTNQIRTMGRYPPRLNDSQEQPTAPLRKPPSEGGRRQVPHAQNDQSKIISALKSQLSNLRFEVGRLIGNERDITPFDRQINQNGHHSHENGQSSVKPPGRITLGYESARQPVPSNQPVMIPTNTSHYHTQIPPGHYISNHISTIQRKPSLPVDGQINVTTIKPLPLENPHQLRDDLRNSQTRQRKLVQERDDLIKKLQQRSQEVEALKGQSFSREERNSMNSIIESMKRHEHDIEKQLLKKIQELQNSIKELQNKVMTKDQELQSLKHQTSSMAQKMKEQTEIYNINTNRYPKLIESLQDTNSHLTNEITNLNEKHRVDIQKLQLAEQKSQAQEQQLHILEKKLNQKNQSVDENRQQRESERRKLIEQINILKVGNQKLFDEVTRLKDMDGKIKSEMDAEKEKWQQDRDRLNQQLDRVNHDRDTLQHERLELQRQLDRLNVSNKQPNSLNSSQTFTRGELSKSSIVVINGNTHAISPQEQAKKQELDQLQNKIQHLKKEKRSLQHDIKNLFETKESVEQSVRLANSSVVQPATKSVEQLRAQLAQKEQVITNLIGDNKSLQKKLKGNDILLRQINQNMIRSELAQLNKKYL